MNRMPNTQSHSVMWVAGEPSGDLHGAALIEKLRMKAPEIDCFGIGGDRMADEGVEICRHMRDMAFMGFWEVIRHLPFIRRVFREMRTLMKKRRPDVLVLIDYPGFNLRLAAMAKRFRIPVMYYISPQIWAWGAHRIKKIRRLVDQMVVIFPFEEDLYRSAGVNVRFVGHPLKDQVRVSGSSWSFLRQHGFEPRATTLALLPGSRQHEVAGLLPAMVDAFVRLQKEIPNLQGFVGKAASLSENTYLPHIKSIPRLKLLENETYEIMAHADFALAASGTATLEIAILETPMVILYRISPVSFFIARHLVRIDHIGLVNIIAGKEIVPELLQKRARGSILSRVVSELLSDQDRLKTMRLELRRVSNLLGPPGASARAADVLFGMLQVKQTAFTGGQ
ncbi:MAG TPA: lipid-A-disaccharide synthase [bacterium]|nr:lipid-A-disaccharide synthase [bacterium]